MSFQIPPHVLKHKRTTLERAEKFVSPVYFTDANLRGKLYPKKAELTSLHHFHPPKRISYDEAVTGAYTEAKVGDSFTPLWSTHWFKLMIDIPRAWLGEKVLLHWDSGSEAMVWKDGVPIQGLTSDHRTHYTLTSKLSENELRQVVYVEMACTGLFGAGAGSFIAPPDLKKNFTLSSAHIVVIDEQVEQLLLDFEVLIDLVKHLPENSNRSHQALFTVNDMVNTVTPGERATYIKAREIAAKFFAQKNGESQHTICAIGNCHIDTAWLWPYSETIRKCARSWSSSVRLLEKYPQFTFAASQAQQFQWVKENYPTLYAKIKHFIKEGRFIPVGGTWVEMDGYVPSGESFIRQFLYGQKFFEEEFGVRCKEFWLPDTFGYSAQLPQIMQQCGIQRFVTQKISWNLVNKFPHHTFWWKGIDGSSVLTHFPPGDSYSMKGKVEELMHTINNFRDKGRCNQSLYLYGHGDGGQGPTEDMIERLDRLKDTDGCPKVEFTTPEEFFYNLEQHESDNLCTWIGELYLELHNATYTTHAKVKQMNRRCEGLLRNAELLSSLSSVQSGDFVYPHEELTRLWKLVLLNQFHDVLPGTSIQQVYVDAMEYYEDVLKNGKNILQQGISSLLNSKTIGSEKTEQVVINTLSWDRIEVITQKPSQGTPPEKKQRSISHQHDSYGKNLALVKAPSCGHSLLVEEQDFKPVTVHKDKVNDLIYLENGLVEAVFDSTGRIVELYRYGIKKNAVPKDSFGNQFVLFDDIPLYWDAWDVMDYHLETRKPVEQVIQHAMVIDEGPLRATIKVSMKISDKSYLNQLIILDACCPYLKFETEVTWFENHKFLKVEFPLDIISMNAWYEIQYGHLARPVHQNTSWDWARFEVCGHKWADFSEYDFGVAVLNDCKYGYSTIGNTLRLSLLRSSKAPDATADMGSHRFTYTVMPHSGTFQEAGVIQAAYELNTPLLIHHADTSSSSSGRINKSYFSIDTKAVILDAVKRSEDCERHLVIRMYEAYGSHATSQIRMNLPITSAAICNSLEEVVDQEDDSAVFKDGILQLSFKPFEIKSVLLKF